MISWRILVCAVVGLAMGTLGCLSARLTPPEDVAVQERVLLTTGYCNCRKCCGWERSWFGLGAPVYSYGPYKGQRKHVGITSTGVEARDGTIAADVSRYPQGTIFKIPGYGFGRVEDTGGAIKGEHIDLWFPSHSAALRWGRRKLAVKVWKR